MKIKYPQCSATNDLQKHCGNCGCKLLVKGVETESLEHATAVETEYEPIIKPSGLFKSFPIEGNAATVPS